MAITVRRRNPGSGFMTIAQAIVWAFLLIRGVQWIFAATAILGMEVVTITEIGIERVAVFFGA